MYYSNGNYEAFARPKKPQDVENKSAYLVGSGLASLSAALFLVRDAQMPGERIHILEELELPGGRRDGIFTVGIGRRHRRLYPEKIPGALPPAGGLPLG